MDSKFVNTLLLMDISSYTETLEQISLHNGENMMEGTPTPEEIAFLAQAYWRLGMNVDNHILAAKAAILEEYAKNVAKELAEFKRLKFSVVDIKNKKDG